jgi:hypothetical protein
MVTQRLNDVFGLDLVEIGGSNEKLGIKCKHTFDPNLSKLSPAVPRGLSSFDSSSEIDPELMEQFKYSMIMISLALILMNENEIEASLFWDSLKRLEINRDEKKHKYLGDVHKFFTVELVKEGYLEYKQIPGVDIPTFKFKSGFRSSLEISKKSILEFVCKYRFRFDIGINLRR